MSRLDDLKPGSAVKGILPNGLVTVVSVHRHGSEALELTYKTPEGKVANELLFRKYYFRHIVVHTRCCLREPK
jgi:hypothetical protein